MNEELTPARAGCRFVSSFFIHTSSFVFCAREQTHFGRTLDDVIIGNQITIVRDENTVPVRPFGVNFCGYEKTISLYHEMSL